MKPRFEFPVKMKPGFEFPVKMKPGFEFSVKMKPGFVLMIFHCACFVACAHFFQPRAQNFS
jgi:hypothetical protein